MQPIPKRKYEKSQHYTLGKISKEYNTTVGTIWSWIFINEMLHNDVQKLLQDKKHKGCVLLPPNISERIFNLIDEQKK
jgi:hypothetical protein